MNDLFDAAIIGAGAFGSACAYHLSKQGKKILVLDRFTPPHNLGSSHGDTRIIREAYYENPLYVPLVQKAYSLWDELENASGKKLLLKTGGLMLGDPAGKVVKGTLKSAQVHHLSYEQLDAKEIKKKFPGFRPDESTTGIFEKNAGILFPEECIRTHLSLADSVKTSFRFDEKVSKINRHHNDVLEIITDKGVYRTAKIVLTSGAWINELLHGTELPLRISRQLLFWFKDKNSSNQTLSPKNFQINIWQLADETTSYGFPDVGDGFKIASAHRGKTTTANEIDRTVSRDEIESMIELARTHFNIEPLFHKYAVCMYTNTPDEDFVIDYHPAHDNIIIASPCSGHGFKFSSAIGKILCDMVLGENIDFNISAFRISRFAVRT